MPRRAASAVGGGLVLTICSAALSTTGQLVYLFTWAGIVASASVIWARE